MADPPSTPAQPIAEASDLGGAVTASPLPGGRRKAALGFIFVTVLLDILGIGIIIPVLPNLVKSFTHGDAGSAADYVGLFGAVWALMQFVFSPVQGALSDHFGRRPVLLISIFGLGADYVLMALSPNLVWLFVGRAISGITAASFSTANAYVADITAPKDRAASFGLLGTAFGIGFIIGPSVGGLLGQVDPRLPFWAAAGLAFANGMYGLFVLPESLPKDRRAPFRLANASPIGSLKLLVRYPGLLQLGGVMFLYFLGFQALQSVTVLYTNLRYGWTPNAMGLCLGGIGLASIVVQAGVVRPFVRRFKERGALYTGLAFGMAGMFVYGWAPTGVLFWLGVPVFGLVGLVQPGVQGMMTRRIRPDEQGRLQAANSSIMAVTGLVGPLLFTQIFHRLVADRRAPILAGAPYYLAALLFLAALSLALLTRSSGETAADA
ncbi:TCR/Tet family MFS transporter, partial [Caulobacter sp. S45]|uniref:TCR/Tet family MFS transporter n=1 Tax=Caulobacter sp. S45 TaxID=1641861 RepID=UPI0015772348